jgi:hypothetical protein
VFCIGAFWDLSTNRAIGFGALGPIPEWTIENYAERRGLRGRAARDAFLMIIRRMDGAWLSWQHDERETAERLRAVKGKR